MKTWKLPPLKAIAAKYIECYWYLEKTANDNHHNHPKLNPYPAAHLIICRDEQRYQYRCDNTHKTGHGCHWIQAHSDTWIIDHSQSFALLGLKFKVGAPYALGFSPHQTALNSVVDIHHNDPLTLEPSTIIEALDLADQDPEQTRIFLDELLQPSLLAHSEDQHSILAQSALALIAQTPIAEMGYRLQCSQRTVERSFLRVTGLTLKQYQSMMRLDEILSYLYSLETKHLNWADIANRFEFSDQSHLIRYLKRAIDQTPTEYAKTRDLTIDIYGNFE